MINPEFPWSEFYLFIEADEVFFMLEYISHLHIVVTWDIN